MKKHTSKSLPNYVKTIITYQSKKLRRKFQLKDITNFHQHSNLVYYGKCSVDRRDKRIEKRVVDNKNYDKNMHISG